MPVRAVKSCDLDCGTILDITGVIKTSSSKHSSSADTYANQLPVEKVSVVLVGFILYPTGT